VRNTIPYILATIIILSFSSCLFAARPKLDVSYAQATRYLSGSIKMQRSTSVQGQPRYMGMTDDKLAVLEVIGEKQNISRATLALALPSDSQRIIKRNSVMALRFMANLFPEWPGSADWTTDAVRAAVLAPGKTVVSVHGKKKIEAVFQKPISMFVLTVLGNEAPADVSFKAAWDKIDAQARQGKAKYVHLLKKDPNLEQFVSRVNFSLDDGYSFVMNSKFLHLTRQQQLQTESKIEGLWRKPVIGNWCFFDGSDRIIDGGS
jgi:hypothetical protein